MTSRADPAVFGRILQMWLEQAGKSRVELVREMAVDRSLISRWMTGERKLNAYHTVKLLMTLRRWLGREWQVVDALDAIVWLSLTWDDVSEAALTEFQQDESVRSFHEWWTSGRAVPLSGPVRSLPAIYVEREELNTLRAWVVERIGYRQPGWEGIIIHGLSGCGKTTLATALSRDEAVRAAFRDGILWLSAPEGDLVRQACQRIKSVLDHTEVSRADWELWIGDPARQVLVIVDDVAEERELTQVLAHKGSQVVVVVTTQRWNDVKSEMERWLPQARIRALELGGLGEEHGRELVEQVLGRPLQDSDEARMVREIGEAVGWHPEGLRLTASEVRDVERRTGNANWTMILSNLNSMQGDLGDRLERLVRRHWERLALWERQRMERLLDMMERGWPFGLDLAAAAWGVRPSQAQEELLKLARNGLIEQLAMNPAAMWWQAQEPQAQWRVLPLVYRTYRAMNRKVAGWIRWWKKRIGRWRYVLSRRKTGDFVPTAPLSFVAAAVPLLLVGVVFKVIVHIALAAAGVIVGHREWSQRWETWTITAAAGTFLRELWETSGHQPTEEIWLVYGGRERLAELLTFVEWVLVGVLSRIAPPTAVFVGWVLATVVMALWAVSQLAWRVWIAGLYGARTWDLRLMLWLAMGVAGLLRWIPAVDRERHLLWEMWRRLGYQHP